ncbi:MAG: HigA family addiction module antidote protein [Spirochaetaceae bacterium]|jgi:addiction module HigA family antidote|nr:HigA family addiction module antidote protein [Spirochaetaceae bacterium]
MPRGKAKGTTAGGKTPAAVLEKFIKKLGLSQAQVAKDVGLSIMTLKNILEGKANVDIERSLIFAKYFGTTADFWIDLQKKAGLAKAKKDAKLQKQLKELKKAKPVKEEKASGAKSKSKTPGAKRGPKPGAKKAAAKSAVKKPRKPRTPNSSTPPATSAPISSFSF